MPLDALRRLRLAGALALACAACDPRRVLRSPGADAATVTAPDSFTVAVETSAGPFELLVRRDLSPLAVDRLYFLFDHDFYRGARFYRVIDGFVAQFGVSGEPAIDSLWVERGIPDEPARGSNVRGTLTFARSGPASRSTVLFINLADNVELDDLEWSGVVGFPPLGRVTSGMEVVDALFGGYGEEPGMWTDSIVAVGNGFLTRRYPQLDSISSARVVTRWGG